MSSVESCTKCHQHTHEKPKPSPLMDIMVAVARVALAVFAAITDPILFAGSFAVGFVWGMVNAIQGKKKEACLEKGVGGCSDGFLEKIAGTRFPEGATFLIGGLTVACHIEHHALVFVPLVGVSIGHWTGNIVTNTLWNCCRKVKPAPTPMPACA